jgi:hypothetical protein
MSKVKPKQHNSKAKKKQIVPPLQKKIVLYFARNEPKTINEVVKDLKSHYKSTWTAFKKLEQRKFIKSVGTKMYQGKEFSRYWLAQDGAYIAILEGAKVDVVIRKTKEIYPDDRETHYFLDATSIFGNDGFEIAFRAILDKGKLEQEDIVATLMNSVLKGISPEAIAKFFILLKQYPEHNLELESLMKELASNMTKFQDKFKKSN